MAGGSQTSQIGIRFFSLESNRKYYNTRAHERFIPTRVRRKVKALMKSAWWIIRELLLLNGRRVVLERLHLYSRH